MRKCIKGILTTIGVAGGIVGGLWIGTKLTSETKVQHIKPYFKRRSPYIFAHRGGMALAPEHTKLAFDKSSEFNVEGFEIDIRLTKDEEIVVMHDAYVDRTSNPILVDCRPICSQCAVSGHCRSNILYCHFNNPANSTCKALKSISV